MALLNSRERYGTLSIKLHWLMLWLFVGLYAVIELKGYFPKGGSIREGLKYTHFLFGFAVFTLVWLRLVLRLIAPSPQVQPPMPKWQALSAHAMHWALYGLMIVVPFMGWMALSAGGKDIPLGLPALRAPDPDLYPTIKGIHKWFGNLGYFLIAGHAVAALVHHFIQKDNTLTRMMPEKKS